MISIKDPGTNIDVRGVSTHERGIPGAVSSSDILDVYEGRPYGLSDGTMDTIDDSMGYRDGSAHPGKDWVAWRKILKDTTE